MDSFVFVFSRSNARILSLSLGHFMNAGQRDRDKIRALEKNATWGRGSGFRLAVVVGELIAYTLC